MSDALYRRSLASWRQADAWAASQVLAPAARVVHLRAGTRGDSVTRCPSKCPDESLPAGMTLDVAKTHPRYQHLLEKIQCELQAGHEGVHRRGAHLSWHDPQRILIGGREQ